MSPEGRSRASVTSEWPTVLTTLVFDEGGTNQSRARQLTGVLALGRHLSSFMMASNIPRDLPKQQALY